jgi:hypothetical protein
MSAWLNLMSEKKDVLKNYQNSDNFRVSSSAYIKIKQITPSFSNDTTQMGNF